MTNSEKKVVFTLIGIFVAILLIVLIVKGVGNSNSNNNLTNIVSNTENSSTSDDYVTNLENDVKLNTSKDLNSTKNYKGLEISNIQFTSENGNSLLLADIKNTNSTKHEQEIISITILGENNTEITTFNTVLPTVESGSSEKLEVHITADVVNAKDFTISEKK